MRCADTLLRNHHDIALMVRVLPAVVRRIEQGHDVDPRMIAGIDRVFQGLVAGSHFPSGTLLLFPSLPAIRPQEAQAAALRRDACIAPLDLFHDVAGRVSSVPLDALADELAAAAARCADTLTALLEAERPLLDRIRHLAGDDHDEGLTAACAHLERQQLGATGREWMAQLVADYADIAETWPQRPASAVAPPPRRGRPPGGHTRSAATH